MQQFVDITQHALYDLCRTMQRQCFATLMIVMIITTTPARAIYADETGKDFGQLAQSQSVESSTSALDLISAPSGLADGCIPCFSNQADRLWLVSSRHLSDNTRCINLQSPNLRVASSDALGNCRPDSLHSLFSQLVPDRPLVIHIHGNRMTEQQAYERGRLIHRNLTANLGGQPIDFMIYSWPSERTGLLFHDGREKARRTEAEGLYFAWLLRELVIRNIPVTVIGYSFGGRIATGALHALAGGHLSGRLLPGQPIRGANIGVGLVAPALEENWLDSGQYHGLASQNIRQMALFYNPRDVILRRYALIDMAARGRALGYAGPRRLAPGVDGSPVSLISRDCSPFLGIRHSEIEYYTQGCRAGGTIAALIRSGL